ncbi:MAG TPA: sigma-70 family RNA polymerase sigma factor [Steroidobacteraceae bacterium]|nr:sigma-70 family RNA polymerase sigma factor [Steroidobacteraceae bacterium]
MRLVEIQLPADLIARACAADECAQAAVYGAVAPGAFALIRRLSGNRALAEDLFQETMLALFQSLSAYRGEAPLGAWVRQIAVSKCLMYLRSPWHRARLRLSSDDADDLRLGELQIPISPAPAVETFDVERALASLTPTARAVVWLYEVEGYSHEEIAHSFGRSVSFSKSQLARAHSRLREWFDPRVDRQTCTSI